MKLDLLVTHYNEPLEVYRPLLDSISCQAGIDFDDIEVLWGNDGTTNEPFGDYPFKITAYDFAHGGVSATRNKLLDLATADYVMFCDCDDRFLNSLALNFLFTAMKDNHDYINAAFVEEKKDFNAYLPHTQDATFVHGKCIKRTFLKKWGIRFNEKLTAHEDVAFNVIAQNLADKLVKIDNPIYLWCDREGSVCREKDFLYKTYPMLIDSKDYIIEQCEKYSIPDQAEIFFLATIYDLYNLSGEEWDKTKAYARAKEFFHKYKHYKLSASGKVTTMVAKMCKNRALQDGRKLPPQTFHDWLVDNLE